MAFAINGSVPGTGQRPTYPASEGVQYPEPVSFDGLGNPCGAVGLPEATVGRDYITAANLAWWMAFFANATDESVTLTSLTIYNELAGAEQTFTSAIMHRPSWNRQESVAGVFYRDFRVRFTQLK